MNPAGGEGNPARAASHDAARAGHIPCCICLEPIHLDDYATARVWVDPQSQSCCAHAQCLIRLGEREMGLR